MADGAPQTSLGIWALGPMVTRFVPGGYQPEHAGESTAERVKRAVDGLGELIDDYEFHYPQELSEENLDDVREALGGHGIYAVCTGTHLNPRFGKGGLSSPDDAVRADALAEALAAARFAGEIGAQMVLWPGVEGYNYPFQTPYRDAWARFIDGVGQVASQCAESGTLLFLEHKNSEPAMKILMRNIGMTLHVIHTLRAQGITNVKVNMDWQHLLMNGESLAEYAALLDAEGLLGHQHANSGWGTFDDDNMVGATAFMETLELALELRRAKLRRERRAARLRPLPVHGGRRRRSGPVGPPVELHLGALGPDRRGRPGGGPIPQGRGARLRARLRRTRCVVMSVCVGLDVGTTGVKAVAISPDGSVVARAERPYPLSTPHPGWSEQDPEDWWRAAEAALAEVSRRARRRRHRALRADARPRGARRGAARAPSRDSLERPAHGEECAEIEDLSASIACRADGKPRAGRVHGAEAALAAPPRAGGLRPDRPDLPAQGLRAAPAHR